MPRITPEEVKEQIKNARVKQQPRKAKAADLTRGYSTAETEHTRSRGI